MKKLPYIIGGIGLVIFGIAGSCDFIEHPVIAIPVITGVLLIFAGMYIERSCSFADEEDFDGSGSVVDDADDGITYITYDGNGSPRYMDFR